MRAALLLLIPILLTACGTADVRQARSDGRVVSGHGLEITLPGGWHGAVSKAGQHDAATLRAATFPVGGLEDIGHSVRPTMGPDDLLLVVADYGSREAPATRLPLSFTREHVVNFEGFLEPVAMTSAVASGRALQLWLVTLHSPTDEQLRRANAVLASLRVDEPQWQAYRDEADRLSVDVPPRWVVSPGSLTPNLAEPREILAVGTGPLLAGGDRCGHVPERALEALGPKDALVTVVEFAEPRGLPPRPPDLMAVEGSEAESRECLSEPRDLDYRVIPFTDEGRDFYVYVAFGERATDERRREAARFLGSLRFERAAAVSLADPEVGVSGRHPASWYHETSLTGFVEPREVVALATYPLRKGAEAGECAPDTAREDMPAGGAFIWLLEYRGELPRSRFPDRPAGFRIPRDGLDENISCFPGPGWSTTFWDSNRQFQLLVAFGGRPSAERVAEVEAILDRLEFETYPPPPPDPYAGWSWISTDPGDSIRTPPGWPSVSGNRAPPDGPYGPSLFFTANRKLRGLPAEDSRDGRDLPGPLPDTTLANWFPDDGVLVWVLEESGRATLAARYEAIDRDWPEPEDFEPVQIFTKPAPHLSWRYTAGEWRGHRFSVWIASGPKAADADLALALKSASSLAVSGVR